MRVKLLRNRNLFALIGFVRVEVGSNNAILFHVQAAANKFFKSEPLNLFMPIGWMQTLNAIPK
jgi:hypothetical protein